ncbi:SIR2 family protein [Pseudomonas denitrificans (nom. rej.)]|uniref:SIR2-like domain-containing protein n=1 Tax=Pseudomonas denitrificans TaxID=43306 RepID=A0A9X7R3H7_PSEDE|nr:SIR2 family protein [Pseudomonas denitrificans (nom. rej.)]QEY70660.1 hypothetical protein F1C79_02760 [Pseudomonas denitrificans (nom. rej.)]
MASASDFIFQISSKISNSTNERVILSLIKEEALQEGKTFLLGPEAGNQYKAIDAIIPEGFRDQPGKTIIEIFISPNINQIFRSSGRISSLFPDAQSIALITDLPDSKVKSYNLALEKAGSHHIVIYGKKLINELSEKYPSISFPLNIKFLTTALKQFKDRSSEASNHQHIKSLQSAYNNDQLVLYIGAGVSLDCGLPSWTELLERLTRSTIEKNVEDANPKEIDEFLSIFKTESSTSPIITARILSNALGNDFAQHVRNSLYLNFDKEKQTELIKQIGALCSPQRAKQGLCAVVNYNFDETLNLELKRRSIPFFNITQESDTPSSNELPIYHPHGYLPKEGEISEKTKSTLVLSEDSYHNQFIDPYSWTNITQLNLLRNNVCLFIGFSMTDPNQRRLLEISQIKRSGARHYVVLKDHWQAKAKNSDTDIGRIFRGLEEASLNKLGVSVLWIKNYNELPEIVKKIKDGDS